MVCATGLSLVEMGEIGPTPLSEVSVLLNIVAYRAAILFWVEEYIQKAGVRAGWYPPHR